MMDHRLIISKLEENITVFRSMLENIPAEEYQWRPAADKWNLLEIVSHLLDEERYDFKARLRSTLEDPKREFAPIDPPGWVKAHNYAANDPRKTLAGFLEERQASVTWLKELKNVNWKNAHVHPKFGPLSAEMFLSEWYSHDLLHLRQIISIRYHYHRSLSGDQVPYAGNW